MSNTNYFVNSTDLKNIFKPLAQGTQYPIPTTFKSGDKDLNEIFAANTLATALIQSGSPTKSWYSIASSSDFSKLAAVAYDDYIYLSTDSGSNWSRAFNAKAIWYSITSSSDGSKLAAAAGGDNGFVYYSNNSGSTWSKANLPNYISYKSITSSSDGSKIAVIGDSIHISTDSGSSWNIIGPGLPFSSITSSSDGTILAACTSFITNADGGIYVSTDSGSSWSKKVTLNTNWNSITSSSDGNILAACAASSANSDGVIYLSKNKGSSWYRTSALNLNWVTIRSSSDGTKLAATTNSGGVYISTNSGGNWSLQTSLPTSSRVWSGLALSSNGNFMAAAVSNPSSVIYISKQSAKTNFISNGNDLNTIFTPI